MARDTPSTAPSSPTPGRPPWRRRLWVVAILAPVVLVGLFWVRAHLDGWVLSAVEQRLSEALRAEVSVGDIDLTVWRPGFRFREIRIARAGGEGDAWEVEIPGGRVAFAWTGLVRLSVEGLTLYEVRLDEPRVRLRRGPPRAQVRKARRNFAIVIERLEVLGGEFVYSEDRAVPFDFAARGVSLEGLWGAGSLVGHTAFRSTLARPPIAHPLPLEIRTGFRWSGSTLDLFDVTANGDGIVLDLDASADWSQGLTVSGRGRVSADLERLQPVLAETFPAVGGKVEGELTFEKGRGTFELEGDFVAERAWFSEFRASRASAHARWSDGHLRLERLVADSLGGSVSGTVDVWPEAPARFLSDVSAEGVGLGEVLDLVRVPLPLVGDVEADVRLGGLAVDRASWDAEARFSVSATSRSEGLPVQGSGIVTIESGRANVSMDRAIIGAAELAIALDVGIADPPPGRSRSLRLELDGTTADAAVTQRGVLRILESIDVAIGDTFQEPLRGAGRIRSAIQVGDETSYDIELDLVDGSWGDQVFDRAAVTAGVRNGIAEIAALNVDSAGQTLRAQGRVTLQPVGIENLDIRAEALDSRWLLDRLNRQVDLDGKISGALNVSRGREGLEGQGSVVLTDATFYGESIASLTANLAFESNRLEIRDARLDGPAFEGLLSADVDLDRSESRLELLEGTVRLEAIERVRAAELPLDGVARVHGAWNATPDGVRGSLTLEGDDWRVWDQALAEGGGTVRFDPGGLEFSLASAPGTTWSVEGNWRWSDDGPFEARVRLDDQRWTPVDPTRVPFGARISGSFGVSGTRADLAAIAVDGTIDALQVDVGSRRLRSQGPFPLDYRDRRLGIGPVVVAGPGSRVEVRLGWDRRDDSIDGSVSGTLGLGFAATVVDDLRAEGSADIEVRIDGKMAEPEVSGTVRVADGRLRWLRFPQTLEQVRIDVAFDESGATVNEYVGVLGGGEVRGAGELTFGEGTVADYRTDLSVQGVRMEFPSDFQGVYDGVLELRGTTDSAMLSGDIDLIRGLYQEEFDLGGALGAESRTVDTSAGLDRGFELNLDLRVRAQGNVWVRNSLAQLESEVDLEIGGTAQRPEVTGRIAALEGGRLDFREVRYDVESASLDFVELERLNPFITLRAKTTVREYEILLRVDGPLDAFEYELTSNPTLPPPDIIALLTTGNTLQAVSGQGRTSQFTGDLAANYFAGALTGRFQRQLQRILGLERIQINPTLVEGETDPTTRITVGKEVSDDVFVVFSQDLGSSQAQIYRVEWQTTRKIRLVAEGTEEGTVAGDVRYTDRFWWRLPERLRAPAVPAERAIVPSRPVRNAGGWGRVVGSVEVRGVPEAERNEVLELTGLIEGQPFSRPEMFRGVQRLRRWLADRGRILGNVRATASDDEGPDIGVDVVYEITLGPQVEVQFEGVKRKEEKKLRRRLTALWVDALFQEDIYTDSVELIRSWYQDNGFYAVDVVAERRLDESPPRVVFSVDRGSPVTVDRVDIVGAEMVSIERVYGLMLTRKPKFFGRRRLDPEVLAQDVEAIRALYRDLGFLRVEVERPRVQLSADARQATVQVRVTEGPQFHIEDIAFTPGVPFSEEAMRKWSGLVVGDVFSPTGLLTAESYLRSAIDAEGHPEVRVQSRVVLENDEAYILFDVLPGEAMRVAAIEIRGNEFTREKIIRREIGLAPGDVLSRDAMLQIQHRLYRLGVFRSVRVQHRPTGDDPGRRILEIEVEEGKPLSMVVGGGFDTEAGLRFNFAMTHENAFGRDQRFSVQARGSSILQRIALTYEEERLFNWRLPAIAQLFWERRDQVSFGVRSRGGSIRLERTFDPKWRGWLRYNLQDDDLFEVFSLPSTIEQRLETIQLGSVGAAGIFDTRDDLFVPTRGTQLNLTAELFAKPFLSEAQFVRTGVNYSRRWRLPLGTNFATAVRLGLADPYGSSDIVPLSQRYFAGGDNTVRGFQRDRLGPTVADILDLGLFPGLADADPTDPVGGEALLIFNQEFRFPLWRKLMGVVFYDVGQVYLTIDDIDAGGLRHAAGGGVRLLTPIGPLRAEYGFKLDREPGESHGEFYLSIGTPF